MSENNCRINIHSSEAQVTADDKTNLNSKTQSSPNNTRQLTGSNADVEKRIVFYIHENHQNGLCSKQELSMHVGSMERINKAIETSNQFVAWGEGKIILAEQLIIRPSDQKILVRYFTDVFKGGGTSPYKLFEKMKVDRRLAAILREKRIDEASKLASIIKLLLPEVKGDASFLHL